MGVFKPRQWAGDDGLAFVRIEQGVGEDSGAGTGFATVWGRNCGLERSSREASGLCLALDQISEWWSISYSIVKSWGGCGTQLKGESASVLITNFMISYTHPRNAN